MATALRNIPEVHMAMPDGVMAVNIDPATGIRDESGMTEYFYNENPPPEITSQLPPMEDPSNAPESAAHQAQQLLQPEINLTPRHSAPPATNNPARPINPEPSSATQGSAQNAAAKILSAN
jgi:penicillin-binding protein 1A